MLKDLSNCGKTIICTIHQASASQLKMFDKLYILSPTGQCIYQGKSSNLINYLSSVGLQCPLHYNPADYGTFKILKIKHFSNNTMVNNFIIFI